MENYQKVQLYHSPTYQDTVVGLFNYLNEKISYKNPCILEMSWYSNTCYAAYQPPNIVTLYLGSLLEDLGYGKKDINKVLSMSTICLAHELYHANQDIDAALYAREAAYRYEVETGAQAMAERFCFDHKADIENRFGFSLSITGEIGDIQECTMYHVPTADAFYSNILLGVYKSVTLTDTFIKTLNANSTVFVDIRQGDRAGRALVKYKDAIMIDPQSVGEFAELVNQFSYPSCDCRYTMAINARRVDERKKIAVFSIEIQSFEISPLRLN